MAAIIEGKAKIATGGAFYNPKMRKLRDISVWLPEGDSISRTLSLLDATAATGVRAIRWLQGGRD